MNLKKAIKILTYHQEWRIGNKDEMKYKPSELTESIDIILNKLNETNISKESK